MKKGVEKHFSNSSVERANDEIWTRDFINTWLKLMPYIISMSHLQKFDVSELSRKETQEIVNDILDGY